MVDQECNLIEFLIKGDFSASPALSKSRFYFTTPTTITFITFVQNTK